MKNSITGQLTGGKKEGSSGPGFKVAHNYQKRVEIHKSSKHAKAKKAKK